MLAYFRILVTPIHQRTANLDGPSAISKEAPYAHPMGGGLRAKTRRPNLFSPSLPNPPRQVKLADSLRSPLFHPPRLTCSQVTSESTSRRAPRRGLGRAIRCARHRPLLENQYGFQDRSTPPEPRQKSIWHAPGTRGVREGSGCMQRQRPHRFSASLAPGHEPPRLAGGLTTGTHGRGKTKRGARGPSLELPENGGGLLPNSGSGC